MLLRFLLILFTFSLISCQNDFLRTILPWWPKNDAFEFRSAPIEDLLKNVTIVPELEKNETLIEELSSEPLIDKVEQIPSSPLDELASNPAPKSNDDGNFIINFDEMGECPRDCSADLREALGIVLQDMSHIERYHRVCNKYTEASTCVNEDVRCDNDDRGMFEMMTSGLNYMCVEQHLAFNATIKCIDDEAGLVQSECETQCQTRNLFMNWVMRSAMQSTIQKGVSGIVGAATGTNANPLAFLQTDGGGQNGWADMLANIGKPPGPQDPQQGFDNFRQFTNDLCRIGDCMLDCIRTKFNTRCEGSAGTLLSEVLVRPIAATQNKLAILRPVLGMFMPEQCAFLHNNADLKKHRIDATMDDELKRMYAEKAAKEIREKTQQDELLSNLVPLDENGVPLARALPELKPVESPLDISLKTLDQLILDMYGKNESEVTTNSNSGDVTTTTVGSADSEDTTSSDVEKSPGDHSSHVESSGSSGSSGDASGGYETSSVSSGDVEASGEASGNVESSGSSGDASGDVANSGESSGKASGDVESSGSSGEASGDDVASGESSGAVESSGDATNSGWSSGEASGDVETSGEASGDVETSGEASGDVETSGEASGEASGDVKSSGSSGEASGDDTASGESSGESSGDVESSGAISDFSGEDLLFSNAKL